MQKFNTKKLYIFFWNFTRKDIEKLYSIDLNSILNIQENELKIHPQAEFDFVEYIVDDETQKHKCLDIPNKVSSNVINTVENFVKSDKKQIILTNYSAFISSFLGQVACGKIQADDIVLFYRGNSTDTNCYYIKRDKIGNKFKAYFVDKNNKEIQLGDNVVACVYNKNKLFYSLSAKNCY